jgi:hypothetical protein
MAVRRPPVSNPVPSEQDEALDSRMEAFINRGMQAQTVSRPGKPIKVLLSIPADLGIRIEAAMAKRKIRIPRNTWLLEAIVDKLEKEES